MKWDSQMHLKLFTKDNKIGKLDFIADSLTDGRYQVGVFDDIATKYIRPILYLKFKDIDQESFREFAEFFDEHKHQIDKLVIDSDEKTEELTRVYQIAKTDNDDPSVWFNYDIFNNKLIVKAYIELHQLSAAGINKILNKRTGI